MPKKLAIIINPVAGRGQYLSSMSSIIEVFCKNGYCVTIYMTEKQGDATAIANNYAMNFDILICCGGDGTLSETINGLIKLKNPPPLGYIPMGTTNDFANSLGLPKNPKKAAELILASNPTEIDIGQFGGVHFSYIAAFGIFTDISYTTPQETKNIMGHFAYVFEGISRLGVIPTHHAVIKHDKGIIEDDFIFGSVTNSLSVAGLLKLDPNNVNLTDGLFEVMLIRPSKNLSDYPRIVGGILSQSYDPEFVSFFHSSELTCCFNKDIPWAIDGENGGRHQEITIRNLSRTLSVLI